MKEFDKILKKYADYVIRESRNNLVRGKNNASQRLSDSLGYSIKDTSVKFEGEYYGQFVDKGVRGAESYYADEGTASSPFKYTNKMPPSKAFDKWTVRKGIAPRDKEGKFLKRQSLNFLIARSIYKKGIRATLFFTKPYEKGQELIGDDFAEAVIKDKLI